MKSVSFVSLAAVAAALLAQPAFAEAPSVEIHGAPAAIAGYAPEAPAAAFDRLFASRTATPVRPLAVRSADELERHFQLALWSTEIATPTLAATAGQHPVEVRR